MPIDDRPFPLPTVQRPISLPDGTAHPGSVFLNAVISHPRWEVGEYSYASSFDPPDCWASRLAPHLFDFSPEKLTIGKFCQIAHGVQIITASANHRYDGLSTYPFAIFGGGPMTDRPSMPPPGKDTRIGHDVWIGQGATLLPGANLGHGVIVGAGAVVGGRIPPYSIVTGNPGQIARARLSPPDVERMLDIAWWDWPIEKILENEAKICGQDLAALAAVGG